MPADGSHQRAGGPPPLPPRQISSASALFPDDVQHDDIPPPSYEAVTAESFDTDYLALAPNDPRLKSSQSLVPSPSEEQGDRRKLLLIFIHGFMGDETSFQSFPVHLHNLVTALLSETHIVHTKIYPRYRSKKKIDFARDDFSRWLKPHEGPTTDVVLLGHSMGGLLCAEVALTPSISDGSLRHRLIGTVNFDVPFLGMHPRVVKSGLASIFNPAPGPSKSPQDSDLGRSGVSVSGSESYFDEMPSEHRSSSQSKGSPSPFTLPHTDPNYNPAFQNDVILPVRKGWEGAWYFINKHHSDLRAATKQLVKSHLEFGGAMADYNGLKLRYTRIRALEEQNANTRKSILGSPAPPPRVRFVNYYTSSTGRPPKQKSPPLEATPLASPTGVPLTARESVTVAQGNANEGEEKSLIESSEESVPRDNGAVETDDDIKDFELVEQAGKSSMDHLEPTPMSEPNEETSDTELWVDATERLELTSSTTGATEDVVYHDLQSSELDENLGTASLSPSTSPTITSQSLPPVPEMPAKPEKPPFYSDKESRKLAEKDYERALKLYFKAVKDREKALREREKLEKKRERQSIKEGKKAQKEVEKSGKDREKVVKKEEKEREKTREKSKTFHDKSLADEQKIAQREWKDALNQSWNDNDSTVGPHHEQGSSRHSAILSPQESRSPLDEQAKSFKDRTFCTLPPKDGSGNRDPTWVRVLMKDVDLVGAHCGLFFPDQKDDRYEQLVGDVGERICQWVGEAESERFIRELEAQDED